MQIRVIFALPSLVPPSLGALGSCPSRLPLDPPLGMGQAMGWNGEARQRERRKGGRRRRATANFNSWRRHC